MEDETGDRHLFDSSERSYQGYRDHKESLFAFLNRSGQSRYAHTRDLLEQWYGAYPAEHQPKLLGDFRATEDSTCLGAFFEMYGCALLHAQGFHVAVEQVLDTTVKRHRPIDFVVDAPGSSGEPLFCMEVTVALDADETHARHKKVQALFESLAHVSSAQLWVSIEVEEESDANLTLRRIRADLQGWLDGLDPDVIATQWRARDYDALPTRVCEEGGWRIVFSPMPKPEGARHASDDTAVHVQYYKAQWASPENALVRALNSKSKGDGSKPTPYGAFAFPYIIAVDVLALNAVGRSDQFIGETLLGKEILLVDSVSGRTRVQTRAPLLAGRPYAENGLWLGRSGPRNRQVSAVLIADELMPWSVAHKTPVLWHNPWAEHPLPIEEWQGPQMIPDMKSGIMRFQAGKPGWELFHLAANWPDNNDTEKDAEE